MTVKRTRGRSCFRVWSQWHGNERSLCCLAQQQQAELRVAAWKEGSPKLGGLVAHMLTKSCLAAKHTQREPAAVALRDDEAVKALAKAANGGLACLQADTQVQFVLPSVMTFMGEILRRGFGLDAMEAGVLSDEMEAPSAKLLADSPATAGTLASALEALFLGMFQVARQQYADRIAAEHSLAKTLRSQQPQALFAPAPAGLAQGGGFGAQAQGAGQRDPRLPHNRQRSGICFTWNGSSCKNGANCRFQHQPPPLHGPAPPPAPPPAQP